MSKKETAKQHGGFQMHPFTYPNRWIDHAQMLADAASTYESEPHNAAVIQLITGIAAMEDEDDRYTIAYFAVEEIFKKTPTAIRALDKFMRDYRDRKIKGTV